MAVVARMYLAEIAHQAYNQGGASIVLRVVAARSENDPNKEWALATPAGELKLTIKNPLAAEMFVPYLAKEFEVRITPVEEVDS